MAKIIIEIDSNRYETLKIHAKEDDSSVARICRKIVNGFIDSLSIDNKKHIKDTSNYSDEEMERDEKGNPIRYTVNGDRIY